MNEQVFLNLIEKYKNEDKSLDRILRDPIFKDIPIAERVDLLKKYGHVIRQGSKVDSTYWKDLALGSVGTAIAGSIAAGPIADKFKYYMAMGEAAGQGVEFTQRPPQASISAINMMLMSSAGGAGLSKFNDLHKSLAARKLVKSYLKPEEGATSTRDAIHVITRS